MRQDRITLGVSSPLSLRNSQALPTACFSIRAVAYPGVMPRVVELFAKRGLIPTRWHSELKDEESTSPSLTIDLEISGLTHQQIGHVTESLRGMVSVQSVLTSVKQCG